MTVKLSDLSYSDRLRLWEEIDTNLEGEIKEHYSNDFIQAVGLKVLMKIPVVEAKSLMLEVVGDYPERRVTSSMMGDKSVVRGLDGRNRPFIAIKVSILDSKSQQKIAEVVELVFKRYSLPSADTKKDGFDEVYVTALSNKGDDDNIYSSGLYETGGMNDKQFQRVGQLLSGEIIPHEFDKKYLMQKA